MKNRQLAINMIANTISFALNAGISLLLTPYLVNTLGNEAYGFIPLASNFVSYISIFTAALNSMASRYISIEINSGNYCKANKYFNSVLISNIIIGIFLIIPSMIIVFNIDNILNIPLHLIHDVKLTFGFVFLNMIIALMGNVFAVSTFCKNRLELSSTRDIKGNIIRLLVILFLFIFFKPKIYFITVTMLIVTVYTVITNIMLTRQLIPEIYLKINNFRWYLVKKLISSGIWNSINQLSSVLLNTLDIMIANIFIDAVASGEYAIVKTIPNFIQSFVAMITMIFVPQFTILYAQKNEKELINSINLSIKFMGLIITLPISFLVVFGDVFYSLWTPGQNIPKLQMLSIITILPMIITGSINTIFNVYTVTNKLKIPSLMLLIMGILKVFITILLLIKTDMGTFAIAITSCILSLLRNLIFTPIYAAKCLNLRWNIFYKAIFRGIICSITMIFITSILKKLIVVDNWLLLIGIAIISSLLSLMVNIHIVFDKQERRSFIYEIIHYKKNN